MLNRSIMQSAKTAINILNKIGDAPHPIVTAGFFSGAVVGGAAGRKHVSKNAGKLKTTAAVVSGATAGAILGAGAGFGLGTFIGELPYALIITLIGSGFGSHLANRKKITEPVYDTEKPATKEKFHRKY